MRTFYDVSLREYTLAMVSPSMTLFTQHYFNGRVTVMAMKCALLRRLKENGNASFLPVLLVFYCRLELQ